VCIASSNGGTTSQDLKTGFLLGGTPRLMQIAILLGALGSALCLGPILMRLNETATVYVPVAKVAPSGLTTDASKLEKREQLQGPQAKGDTGTYHVWQKTDTAGGPAGRYLVDDAGRAVWLVDPGINGQFTERPDGSTVRKFDAPKATLVSYIIKGILDRKLPWALVLLGVMIAITLELCGVPSLVFAVGVYLPISSSAPLFVGGAIRWPRRPGDAEKSRLRADGRRRICRRDRQEPGRPPGFGLHRGWRHCRHRYRVPRRCAQRRRRKTAKVGRCEQPVFAGPELGPTVVATLCSDHGLSLPRGAGEAFDGGETEVALSLA